MTSHVKLRKDKDGVVIYDTQIKEVRSQLVEQVKVLDLQLEHKSQQLQDLSEYLRRRGEIEGDYARSLERLADRFTAKTKRKEPSGHSVAQMWLTLLTQTRQESRDHSGLSESCSNLLIQPLANCLEYTQRLSRKSKEVCAQLQDGLLKVTTELQTAWRTYYQYFSDSVCADGKLKDAEKQEEKQKTKKMERLIEKRQGKVQEVRVKCSKARNDYLLTLAAANASMNKYYLQDVSSLIDCTDTGYHLTVGRMMRAYLSRWSHAQSNLSSGLQQIQGTVCEVGAVYELGSELETRFKQIQNRLTTVSQETEEASKGLLAGRSLMLEGICDDDLEPSGGDTGSHQEDAAGNQAIKPSAARRRANLLETENLYLTKVKEYLLGSSLVSKLQAKHDLLKVAVEKAQATNGQQGRLNLKSVHMRRNQSKTNLIHKPFSSDMLQFIKASGQEIPEVVESCIRFINFNGLHHEGVFRVPEMESETEGVAHLRAVISSYPAPLVVVMRYLFAFLHHLSQYSDENMMQPYNLAVCFGPSLVRGASDVDVVTLQPQINALVMSLIVQHESVFPSQAEVQGPVYEKCMTLEQDDCEPNLEEGDGDSECFQAPDSEAACQGDASSTVPKAERSRSVGRSSSDKRLSRHAPAGGSVSAGTKFFNLKLPVGPQGKLLPHSPGYIRGSQNSSSEDFTSHVDKEVCRQMDIVFKQLLNRQGPQDPSSISSSSSQPAQSQLKKKKA
ncbi:hypothetical protein NHX12_013023 [Muraenolepis orangiensis]|uniref:Rho GTPase activating protein 4a n=1 Tax=Muraenolepis orangiensis TaxID=630683 RepID=A0A9Q0DE54_9TELE|nr:hypothetical protein NHX12_013023 [Muraenolepis orangiensis]